MSCPTTYVIIIQPLDKLTSALRKFAGHLEACSAVVDTFEIAVLMSCASLYHTRDVKIDVLYVANCT